MIPKIKSFKPMDNFILSVNFDSGEHVKYDVMDDVNTIPDFRPLIDLEGLFECARLDESRTCIYWNDRIDLPSDTILEYGVKC